MSDPVNPYPYSGPHGEVRYAGAWPAEKFPTQLIETSYTTPLFARPLEYDRIALTWTQPVGTDWDQAKIIRNSYGCPVSVLDGVEVVSWNRGSSVSTHTDIGLTGGKFYYYSLFIRADLNEDTIYDTWVRTGKTECVLTAPQGWKEAVRDAIPWHYHVMDQRLGEDRPLENLLNLFAFETDTAHTEISTLLRLFDEHEAGARSFRAMAKSLGIDYEYSAGDVRMRELIFNLLSLRRIKGTAPALEGYVHAVTGYNTSVVLGRNLLLSNDSSDFRALSASSWSNVVTYQTGDFVLHSDQLWVSKQDTNLNHTPADGAWWETTGYGDWLCPVTNTLRLSRRTSSPPGTRDGSDNDRGYLAITNATGGILYDPYIQLSVDAPDFLRCIPLEMGDLFVDTFTRDNSSFLGPNWDTTDPGWETQAWRAVHTGSGGAALRTHDGFNDGFIEFTIGAPLSVGQGVVFRVDSFGTGFALLYAGGGTQDWKLYELDAGLVVGSVLTTIVGTTTPAPNTSGTVVKVTYSGDVISMEWDGVFRAEYTSSTNKLESGHGLYSSGAGTGTWNSYSSGLIGATRVIPSYTFSTYLMWNGGAGTANVGFQWADRHGDGIDVSSTLPAPINTNTADWDDPEGRHAVGPVVPPANAVYARPYVMINEMDVGDVVWMDDAMVEMSDTVGDYEPPRKVNIYCCPDRTNWIANPTFGANLNGWTSDNVTLTRQVTGGTFGDERARLITVAGGGSVTYAENSPTISSVHYIPVKPDHDYTLSLSIKDVSTAPPATENVQLHMEIDWMDGITLISTSSSAPQATVSTGYDNHALLWTALEHGETGNDISVWLKDPGRDEGLAEAGDATHLQDTGKAWTVNQWATGTVVIIAGTGAGQSRTVSSNTANTLTVSSAWNTDPDATSYYVVTKPALSAALAVGVTGNDIVVSLATNGSGVITSTASAVKAAVEASVPASALVTVDHRDGSTGASACVDSSVVHLSGGTGSPVLAPLGHWNRISFTSRSPTLSATSTDGATVSADPTYARVRLVVEPGVEVGRELSLDGVMFEEGNRSLPFFDGSTSSVYDEYNWIGGEDESWSSYHHHLSIREAVVSLHLDEWVPGEADWELWFRCADYAEPPQSPAHRLLTEDSDHLVTEGEDFINLEGS